MIDKPRILIFYDYFYPAYKAGGPIQSLTNLVVSLQPVYDISVVTSAHDLNDNRIPAQVKADTWNEVKLPSSAAVVKVWYASEGALKRATIKEIIKQVDPAVVYLNGMFSFRFVLLPLISIKKIRLVICPRGMLQKGALAGKAFKKKIFLSVMKMSGLMNKVTWHATNEAEQSDIQRELPGNGKIFVAGNIPKAPVERITVVPKREGELSLIYLSLISEKKNLLQAIHVIAGFKENISLDIYGPVKDDAYWDSCLKAIEESNNKVKYKGTVMPEMVQDVFSKYHASILLTKGENFGHALYESLSAGRPVITSHFTPWNKLQKQNAGWNVDLSDERNITSTIAGISQMNQSSYDQFCAGAYTLAKEYYRHGFDLESYKILFSS